MDTFTPISYADVVFAKEVDLPPGCYYIHHVEPFHKHLISFPLYFDGFDWFGGEEIGIPMSNEELRPLCRTLLSLYSVLTNTYFN